MVGIAAARKAAPHGVVSEDFFGRAASVSLSAAFIAGKNTITNL
jgi:hypothetical protein